MRGMRRVLAAGLLLASSGAWAHAHLKESIPSAGARVSAPPALTLVFTEAARLTALTLTRGAAAPIRLTPPQTAQQRVSVALPALAPGDYVVRFRALGADGHLVPGELRFSVLP